MKYIKKLLCFALLLWLAAPAMAAEKEGESLDISHIVLEHIKDSYEWHITDVARLL